MKNDFIEKNVRTRLIIAGINELEERGIRDFSLRRVALRAEVSCAAPYRHFKDKEDFISEIIKYISSKWMLLCHEVEKVFSSDKRRLIIELAVANLRFWLANANYRTVLMTLSTSSGDVLSDFDGPLINSVREWCALSGEDAQTKIFTVRALLYGCVMMTSGDTLRADLPTLLRRELEEIF